MFASSICDELAERVDGIVHYESRMKIPKNDENIDGFPNIFAISLFH